MCADAVRPSIADRGARRSLLLLLSLWVAACGGGGGSAGNPPAPPPVPTPSPPPSPSPAPPPAPGAAPVITAPAALADGLSGSLSLAADAPGAAAVEFQIDGLALPEDTSAPFAAVVDTQLHAAGQHVLRARSRLADGSRSAWASVTVRFGGSRALPAGFTKTEGWVSGLQSATALAQAPDGRWFVAQQGGVVRIVKQGQLLATPFAVLPTAAVGERGLIGIALHPDFAANGWVYVHYTSAQGGAHNRISRLVAAGDVASGPEQVLVNLPALSQATNHNGGALHFGSDGKLYAGVGDNADSAKAQDRNHPFGKLLRFNDDGSIPSDNPFCGTPGQLGCAVWAMGLRNPFTFAMQPGSGRLHINDVGANAWEEINLGAAGANYGWPGSEGPNGVAAGHTAPVFAYRHGEGNPPGAGPGGFFSGIAIVGAAFYPAGGAFPAAYHGSYFFADLGTGVIARLDPAEPALASSFASVDISPRDLRVGADGALYVLGATTITRITTP
ncbi:PQQ-dependent sugar dehydrogenase [Aquincola sp. S2]|uniref:PQQ-dependent sugar dehydrogenase n=1 Tax=Pseudaquabacterium terrae TaxID=2732868 RepID=A0ABX2EA96_9BURK|nr:PQQ-dependent sugar dehydrogenase [Aquabacterium terrae]NRF65991.1 PQQ-dependent sugar dehydrogenase [Aquabacterium terrae]